VQRDFILVECTMSMNYLSLVVLYMVILPWVLNVMKKCWEYYKILSTIQLFGAQIKKKMLKEMINHNLQFLMVLQLNPMHQFWILHLLLSMSSKHTRLSLYHYFCNIYVNIKCHYVMIHPQACKLGSVVTTPFHETQKLDTSFELLSI